MISHHPSRSTIPASKPHCPLSRSITPSKPSSPPHLYNTPAPSQNPTMSKTPDPTLAQREAMTASYNTFLHNTSLTMLFLAPALIALPPRKLDLYTVALATSFVASANHLTKERTGRGLLDNMPFASTSRAAARKTTAEEFREKYRVEKELRRLLEEPVTASATTSAGRPPS